MSHFAELKVEFSQKNEAELVSALEQQFGKGSVEVHNEPKALFGYEGDNRSVVSQHSPDYAPPCHIIIRRMNVGSMANDVGYRRNRDGTYSAFISEYDNRSTFTAKKQNAVFQEYTLKVSEKSMRTKGYGSFKRVPLSDGSIRLEAAKFVK